jgi:hypothetical protein
MTLSLAFDSAGEKKERTAPKHFEKDFLLMFLFFGIFFSLF